MFNKPERIPYCYHPTTVAVISEDIEFVQSLTELLRPIALVKAFSDTASLFQYLTHEGGQHFGKRFEQELSNANTLEANPFAKVSLEMYRKERFQEVSVVTLDSTLQTAQSTLEYLALHYPYMRRLLLTSDSAVETSPTHLARHVHKNEPNLLGILRSLILQKQWSFFSDLSEKICDPFLNQRHEHLPDYLRQSYFFDFFFQFFTEQGFCEYYLMDAQANFVLLDKKGVPAWLMIRSESEIQQEILFLEEFLSENPSEKLKDCLEKLKKRERATFFVSDEDTQIPMQDWQRLMHPISSLSLQGQSFYYGLIKDISKHPKPQNPPYPSGFESVLQ